MKTNIKVALIGCVGVIGGAIITGLFTHSGNSIDVQGNANSPIIQGVQGDVSIGVSEDKIEKIIEAKMSEVISAIREKDQNAVSLGTVANLRKSFDLGFALFSSDGITIKFAPSGGVDWLDVDWSGANLARLDEEYWVNNPQIVDNKQYAKILSAFSFKLPPIGKASSPIAYNKSGLQIWVFSLSMQDGYVAYGIGLTLEKEPSGFEIIPPTWRVGRL